MSLELFVALALHRVLGGESFSIRQDNPKDARERVFCSHVPDLTSDRGAATGSTLGAQGRFVAAQLRDMDEIDQQGRITHDRHGERHWRNRAQRGQHPN